MASGNFNINSIIDVRQYDYINSATERSSMLKDVTVYSTSTTLPSGRFTANPINRFIFVRSQTNDKVLPEDYVVNPNTTYSMFVKTYTNNLSVYPTALGSWIVEAYQEDNKTKYRLPSQNPQLSVFKTLNANTDNNFYNVPIYGIMPFNARGFLHDGKFGEKDILVRRLNHNDITDWDQALANWMNIHGGSDEGDEPQYSGNIFENGIYVSGGEGGVFDNINVSGTAQFTGNTIIDLEDFLLRTYIENKTGGEYDYVLFDDYIREVTGGDNIIYTDACTNAYITYSDKSGNEYKIYYPVIDGDLGVYVNALDIQNWQNKVRVKIYKDNKFEGDISNIKNKIIAVKQPAEEGSNILNNYIEFVFKNLNLAEDFDLNGDGILDAQDVYGWGFGNAAMGEWYRPGTGHELGEGTPDYNILVNNNIHPQQGYDQFSSMLPGGNGWTGAWGLDPGEGASPLVNYYFNFEDSIGIAGDWVDISPDSNQALKYANKISLYKYLIKDWDSNRDFATILNNAGFDIENDRPAFHDLINGDFEVNDWVGKGWEKLIKEYNTDVFFGSILTDDPDEPLHMNFINNALKFVVSQLSPIDIWESLGGPVASSINKVSDSSYQISGSGSGDAVLSNDLTVQLENDSLGAIFSGQTYPAGTSLEQILLDLLQERFCDSEYVLPDFRCTNTIYKTEDNLTISANHEVVHRNINYQSIYQYTANDGPLKNLKFYKKSGNNYTELTDWGRNWERSYLDSEMRIGTPDTSGVISNSGNLSSLQAPTVYYAYPIGTLDNSALLKIDSKGCYNGYPKDGEVVSSIWKDNPEKKGYGVKKANDANAAAGEKLRDANGNPICSCADRISEKIAPGVIPAKITLKYPVFYTTMTTWPSETFDSSIFDGRQRTIPSGGYTLSGGGYTWNVVQYNSTCLKDISLPVGTRYMIVVVSANKTIQSATITSQGFTSVFSSYTELTRDNAISVHYVDDLDYAMSTKTYKFEWPSTDLVGADTTITINLN